MHSHWGDNDDVNKGANFVCGNHNVDALTRKVECG